MKIYLAARYEMRVETAAIGSILTKAGHVITSRWLDGHGASNIYPQLDAAREDIEDIDSAEALVCLTGGLKSTGRNIEFGYALGQGKLLYVLGPRESVFHHLPNVLQVKDYVELLMELSTRDCICKPLKPGEKNQLDMSCLVHGPWRIRPAWWKKGKCSCVNGCKSSTCDKL